MGKRPESKHLRTGGKKQQNLLLSHLNCCCNITWLHFKKHTGSPSCSYGSDMSREVATPTAHNSFENYGTAWFLVIATVAPFNSVNLEDTLFSFMVSRCLENLWHIVTSVLLVVPDTHDLNYEPFKTWSCCWCKDTWMQPKLWKCLINSSQQKLNRNLNVVDLESWSCFFNAFFTLSLWVACVIGKKNHCVQWN